ncbi:hypothetical protein, partial [Lentibacter algarum]|uniref:hypothetical protein n=1 Tax=Lentibacter algarum TaxID=576131 RepID=UPI0023546D2D
MGTITKLPSGKYRAQVRRAGIYRSGTFNRKSEAQGFIATIEGSLNSATGTIVAPNGMTFATLCTAYVDQVQTGRSRRADLAKIAKGVLGPIPAGKLNALHLSEFVKQRLDAGITGQTLAGDLSAVSAVLKWARRVKQIQVDDTLAKNARASLSAQRINTRSNSRTRLPSPDELERITEHVEARPK